jgi:hypothetical protein
MNKSNGLSRYGLWMVLTMGLLAACTSGAAPRFASPTPVLTVTPLPRSSPALIPTVTSAPVVATAGSEAAAGAAAAPTNTLPAQPLVQLASGDVVTVTRVFSAGTQERIYDNQTVRVSTELSTVYTYLISGTTQVETITQDQAAPVAISTPAADTAANAEGGPLPITPATLQAVGDKLGFAVRAPGWLPPGYAPATDGLSYSAAQKWAWQRYFASWGTRKFVWLEFSQQSRRVLPVWNPVGGLSDIGASAQVQSVQVQGQPGEYVAGGWVRTTTSETANGQVRIIQVYQWKELEPPSVARLRWAQDEFWFEVVFHGECWQYLCGDKDTLVRVAEALQ